MRRPYYDYQKIEKNLADIRENLKPTANPNLAPLDSAVLEKLGHLCPNSKNLPEQQRLTNLYRNLITKMPKANMHVHLDKMPKTPEDVEEIIYSFYEACYHDNVIFTLPSINWTACQNFMSYIQFNKAHNKALLRGMQDFKEVTVLQSRYSLENPQNDFLFGFMNNFMLHPNPLIQSIDLALNTNKTQLKDYEQLLYQLDRQRQSKNKPWFFITAQMGSYSNEQVYKYLDWATNGWKIANNEEILSEMNNGIDKFRFVLCPLRDLTFNHTKIPYLSKHTSCKKLIDKGMVALGSDNFLIFGNITNVYQLLFEEMNVSLAQLLRCTKNALSMASTPAMSSLHAKKSGHSEYYLQLRQVAELKIAIFQEYWALLPHIVQLEEKVAQQFFDIDLKTSIRELSKLKTLVEESNPDVQFAMKRIIEFKHRIQEGMDKILSTTEHMASEFYTDCAKQLVDCSTKIPKHQNLSPANFSTPTANNPASLFHTLNKSTVKECLKKITPGEHWGVNISKNKAWLEVGSTEEAEVIMTCFMKQGYKDIACMFKKGTELPVVLLTRLHLSKLNRFIAIQPYELKDENSNLLWNI